METVVALNPPLSCDKSFSFTSTSTFFCNLTLRRKKAWCSPWYCKKRNLIIYIYKTVDLNILLRQPKKKKKKGKGMGVFFFFFYFGTFCKMGNNIFSLGILLSTDTHTHTHNSILIIFYPLNWVSTKRSLFPFVVKDIEEEKEMILCAQQCCGLL